MTPKPLDKTSLKRELKIHAKALNIPSGAANVFIDQTLSTIDKTLGTKKLITEQDLTRAIVKELKKYHADFAYVYKNRDKII
jgi:hypothetical protein